MSIPDVLALDPGDALLVIDMQVDFVSGALAIAGAEALVPVVNGYARAFAHRGLPIAYTRDWHPADHASFFAQGGPWPAHCVAGFPGAELVPELEVFEGSLVVSKGRQPGEPGYSAFEGTDLDAELRRLGVRRLFVCGLATDHCVLATVTDALRLRWPTTVLADAVLPVEAKAGDGERALHEMILAGAQVADRADLAAVAAAHG